MNSSSSPFHHIGFFPSEFYGSVTAQNHVTFPGLFQRPQNQSQLKQSECNPKSKLQNPRHVSTGRVKEVLCAYVAVHAVPLGVVEDIEGLRAELELHFVFWFEDLVHRRIEVGATGQVQTVPA